MAVPVAIAAAGKIAAKEGVKVAAKEVAKNAAKETAKNVVKEGAKNAAKEGAKDAVKKGAEGIAKQGVENAVKDVGQNAVKNTVEDGFKGKAKDIVSDSSKGIPSKVESSSVPAPRSTTGQLKDATVDKVKEKAKDQTRSAIDDVTDRPRSDDSVENDVSGGGEASENLQSDLGKNPEQQAEAGIDPKAALEAAKNIANNPLVKTASKVHPAANAAVNTAANVLNQADKVAKAANAVNAATPNVPKPKSTAGGLVGKPAGATPAPRKKAPAKPKNPVEGAAKKAFDKTPVGKAKKAVDKLSGKDKAKPGLKGSLNGGGEKEKKDPGAELAGRVAGHIVKKAALTLILLLFPLLMVLGCVGIIFGLAMGGGDASGKPSVLEYSKDQIPVVRTPLCYMPDDENKGSGGSSSSSSSSSSSDYSDTLIIGDSIVDDWCTGKIIDEMMPGITRDAVSSRTIEDLRNVGAPDEGILYYVEHADKKYKRYVIETGNNEGSGEGLTPRHAEQIISTLGKDKDIYFVAMYGGSENGMANTKATMATIDQMTEKYSNVHKIDWYSVVKDHASEWLDGVLCHPNTDEAKQAYAKCIKDGLGASSSSNIKSGEECGKKKDEEENKPFTGDWCYYCQGDPQWAGVDYGNVVIGPSGCWITSFAMAWTTYSGEEHRPDQVVGNTTAFISNGLGSLPNFASELERLTNGKVAGEYLGSWDKAKCDAALEKGGCIFIFMSGQHMVDVIGHNGGDTYTIADPATGASSEINITSSGDISGYAQNPGCVNVSDCAYVAPK